MDYGKCKLACDALRTSSDSSLCRYYAAILKTLAKKQVLRLHVGLKRSLCKKCHNLLIPGETATVRTGNKSTKLITVTCRECNTTKRFPWKKDFELWTNT